MKFSIFKSRRFKIAGLLTAVLGSLVSGIALAETTGIPITTIATTVDNSVLSLATILIDVSLIAGIGFIMASFFKFHQHKQNPTQVSMSQGVSLLLIGCGLTLVPLLVPTASQAVLGTNAKTSQVGGSDIKALIGGTGGGSN